MRTKRGASKLNKMHRLALSKESYFSIFCFCFLYEVYFLSCIEKKSMMM